MSKIKGLQRKLRIIKIIKKLSFFYENKIKKEKDYILTFVTHCNSVIKLYLKSNTYIKTMLFLFLTLFEKNT